MKYPVIYLPVKYRDELFLDKFPNAGPHPNISGMRRIYGDDAFLIMCGSYLYCVPEEIYKKKY